jgi:hypothetical protein
MYGEDDFHWQFHAYCYLRAVDGAYSVPFFDIVFLYRSFVFIVSALVVEICSW